MLLRSSGYEAGVGEEDNVMFVEEDCAENVLKQGSRFFADGGEGVKAYGVLADVPLTVCVVIMNL